MQVIDKPFVAGSVYVINDDVVHCVQVTDWHSGPLAAVQVAFFVGLEGQYQLTRWADGTVFRITKRPNPSSRIAK